MNEETPVKAQKGWEPMWNSENSHQQAMEGERAEQQPTGEQTRAFEQVLRFQSEIEEQSQRVARALNPIAEALDNGGHVPPEMEWHVRAQILRAHLHLDDLEQVLASIDEQFAGKSVTRLSTSMKDWCWVGQKGL
jgi:DNA-directed RNA polymerase specialized sigma54-like protein